MIQEYSHLQPGLYLFTPEGEPYYIDDPYRDGQTFQVIDLDSSYKGGVLEPGVSAITNSPIPLDYRGYLYYLTEIMSYLFKDVEVVAMYEDGFIELSCEGVVIYVVPCKDE